MTSKLHIDFETRSIVDLKKAGVYVYAQHPSTDIWCAAFSVDDEPIGLWTPGGSSGDVLYAIKHTDIKIAHNAAFERIVWRYVLTPRYGWPEPELVQWRCTMAMALAMSLPGSLENAAAAVGLDVRKDMEGHATMMRMARPRRARKGEHPDGVYWFEDEARRQRLYDYCVNDVRVERELERRLVPLRPFEQELWWLDQTINDRGVHVDTALCEAALKIVDTAAEWLNEEMRVVTRGAVSACTNVGQITAWLRDNGCPDVDSIAKGRIDELLTWNLPPDVRRVLELRKEAAKASVAKISALLTGKNDDDRARGLLQFHAASTGRWAGRRFQPQNIKRPEMEEADIEAAIETVATGDADAVRMLFGEPLAVVGDCLRGMVRAADGKRLFAADFSNIEGRLIAWYGGEHWKLDAFRACDVGEGPDIYELTAGKILRKPAAEITKPERQSHGKVPELALGFGGGVGAFQKMAFTYGVEFTDAQAEEIKHGWRQEHPGVVRYWYALSDAALRAVERRGEIVHCGPVAFRVAGSFCWMRLPSGRAICYPYPTIENVCTPWGAHKPIFSYMGVDSYTRKWERQYAHGGVLFNNVVQGTARDIEAEAMFRVEQAGYPVVLTVHDEVVSEREGGDVSEFQSLMVVSPSWATGLPIAAGAWCGERYRK